MAPDLPEDILHLITDELYQRRDFDTLFQCCSTSKALATLALAALYRYVKETNMIQEVD